MAASTRAEEGSSFYPTMYFYDEDGVAMTPTTLYWKLTDLEGNIIRATVTVGAPSTSLTVALTGTDLSCLGNDMTARLWTVWGTFNSGTHGAGQAFLFQAKFNIQPTIGG